MRLFLLIVKREIEDSGMAPESEWGPVPPTDSKGGRSVLSSAAGTW